MKAEWKLFPGSPYPMGLSVGAAGEMNFAAALHTKEECGVILYPKKGGRTIRLPFRKENKVGNVYCLKVSGLKPEEYDYNFYVGEDIITDSYAKAVYGNEKWGHKVNPDLRGACVVPEFEWGQDAFPMTPMKDSILYLIHVRGFTKHTSSGVKNKGTFAGIQEKIPYLKELGITAVELMPAYEFLELEKEEESSCQGAPAAMSDAVLHYMDRPEEDKKPRTNYWGYKKGFYFAPKASYSTSCPSAEMKQMVKELHENGIEVIMQFYFPKEVPQGFMMQVLQYWVFEYHIDGFHLLGERIPAELLATEPLFENTKLFYYDFPVDAIYGGKEAADYKNLAIYNDDFMYAMRRYLKSDEDTLASALNFLKRNPRQTGTVNYITNYSGFTLADMVAYERKQNEANGEDNRDGSDYNATWNCGCEGKTKKKAILKLRLQQRKNAILLLMTAQGTPMIVSGDEFGQSHEGNNNPYCQDNSINWLNWNQIKTQHEFFDFVKKVIAFRKEHEILHREEEFTMLDFLACGYPDLSYHGEEAWKLNTDHLSRYAGVMYCGHYAADGRGKEDNFVYIAYNMHWQDHVLALPKLEKGLEWVSILSTVAEDGEECCEQGAEVKARSIRILISQKKDRG